MNHDEHVHNKSLPLLLSKLSFVFDGSPAELSFHMLSTFGRTLLLQANPNVNERRCFSSL
jgi:hypothetical protein